MWSLTVDGRVSASVISQWLYALLWQNATPFLLVRRIISCIVTELYFTSESSNAFILLFLQHKVKVISSLPWLQKKGEKWKDSPGEKVWFHAQLASSFPVVHLNISIFTNRNWRFVVLHRRTRVLLFVETSTRRRFRIFIYSLFDVPCGSQQYRPNAFKHFDMSYVSLVNFSTNQNTVLSA